MVAVRHVDELRGDPQLRSCLPHPALEHRADGELVPDDAQILVLALERKGGRPTGNPRSEEHTSELQSQSNLVCRLLLEKKKYHKRSSPDEYLFPPPGRRTRVHHAEH